MSLKKDSQIAQVISALSESMAPQLIDAIKTMTRNKPAEKKESSEDL
jgi:hypothetical protein